MTKTRKAVVSTLAILALYALDTFNFWLRFNAMEIDCDRAKIHIHRLDNTDNEK